MTFLAVLALCASIVALVYAIRAPIKPTCSAQLRNSGPQNYEGESE